MKVAISVKEKNEERVIFTEEKQCPLSCIILVLIVDEILGLEIHTRERDLQTSEQDKVPSLKAN